MSDFSGVDVGFRVCGRWLVSGVVVSVVGLGALTGCGDREVGSPGDAAPMVVLRPAVVPDGVPAVAVSRLVRQPAGHGGRLAVEGVVVRCTPELGAMLLVDLDEFRSCGLNACTDAAMPVRVDLAAYEGVLPPPGASVTMIGDFQALERGFAFELLEVHHEGGVVLARRPELTDLGRLWRPAHAALVA